MNPYMALVFFFFLNIFISSKNYSCSAVISTYSKAVIYTYISLYLHVYLYTGSNVAPRAMPFWGVAKTSGVGISR